MLEFLTGRNWPIALDLGSDSIRMLQMKRVGRTVRAIAAGRWQMGEGADDPRVRHDQIVAAVRGMLRGGTFRGRRVATALSCEELSIKTVRVPHLAPAELDKTICQEARERFSFPLQRDQLNYINAGQIRQGAELRDEVLMLAASREVVDDHLRLLSDMGLEPECIEAGPVALFRSFERFLRRRADENAVSVVVDVGWRGTRVVVARGREIVFIKNIDIGGRKFTESVARQLSIPQAEAQELRTRSRRQKSESESPTKESQPKRGTVDWTLYDAMRAEVETLGKEIALCLRYCAVTFRGLRPDRVVLTGGESYDQAVVEILGQHVGVPCQVGQPLRGLDVSGVDLGGDRRGPGAEWALCAGLSARHADLSGSATETDDAERRLSA